MPKAANGAYSPNSSSGSGLAPGQPSLWAGGGGGDGGAPTASFASSAPAAPKNPYTATGPAAPDVPTWHEDGTYPTTAVPPTPTPKPAAPTVGSMSLDVSSPSGLGASIAASAQQGGDLFSGLGNALFGHGGLIAGPADVAEQAIGQSPLGPVVGLAGTALFGGLKAAGDAVQPIASGPINAVTGAAQGALDTVANVADNTGVGVLPGAGGAMDILNRQQFDSIPASPEKAAVEAQIAANPDAAGHLRTTFIQSYVQDQQKVNPDLYPELKTAPGSLGDALMASLTGIGLFSRPFERAVAGAGKADGLNRLQAIEAVIEGRTYDAGPGGPSTATGDVQFSGGSAKPTDNEQFAYDQWKSGVWSVDQALTFLSASSAGISHDPALEIAGQVALDPTVWGSLGASALSKLGMTAVRLAALPADAEALIRPAGTAAKYNLLGHLAENEHVGETLATLGKHVYTPIQNNMLGQAAQIARTIIDPLHAIGGHGVVQTAGVDLAAEDVTRVMEGAYGQLASRQVSADMNELGLLHDLADAKATYATNKARALIVAQYVRGELANTLRKPLGGIGDIADRLSQAAPADFADLLKQGMVTVAKRDWTGDAVANLGARMEAFFGGQSAGEWAKALSGKSTDYLGQLHAATYGAATRQFLDAIGKSTNILGVADAQGMKLPRLILLNTTTLTSLGAQGILDGIKAAKDAMDLKGAAELIRDAQARYPELAYVRLDEANLSHSIERFTTQLAHQLEDGVLPAQLTDREIAKLPQPLLDLHGKMGGTFDFGFRPEDDQLFNITRDGEGRYVLAGDPWVDHVAVSHPGYRGIGALRYNAAGMPVIGEAADKAGRMLDYVDAAAKTLTGKVHTATIAEAAKSRFVEQVAHDAPGLTPVEARRIFDGVSEAAQLHKASARGLFASEMWSAVEHLVPDSVRLSGELTQRNLMNMIVHAYEGDLRFVGLTQKFTGRAKSILAAKSGGNFAGWFSEKLYTDIKFRANPIFQAQERAEPWVLNGMRGSNPAFGTKATEVDRMTMQEARNLRDSGVIRSTDIDQREMSNQALLGDAVRAEMQRNPSAWNQLSDVQGAKSLNLARTYQANLGQAMRDIFDRYQPGLFDDIVANYSKHGLVSDAEAAARYIAEQRLAGDVELHSVIRPGDAEPAFKNAVGMAEMFKPNSFGELRGLNLDYMARALGMTTLDKKGVDSAGALRAALADHGSGVTMDRVANALRNYGADEGYIRRVTNALDFHWDGFWRTAAARYNLSAGESRRFQEMFTEAARVRGMTPVDYMSQVFSPMIGGGKDAAIESLDSGVSMLRAPKDATSLDFATQVADVFRHHLDPSAQQTLMDAFEKDLPSQINATMQRGAQVTSRNLQGTLSEFRGGATTAGGAVRPTHALSPEGLQRGRFVTQSQVDALTARGQAILADHANAARTPILAEPGAYDRVADEAFQRAQTGGATLDPHTGQPFAPAAAAEGPYLTAVGEQVGVPFADAADPAKFRAAFDQFVADNRAELEKADHYIGVYRNPDTNLVEFDVSVTTPTAADTEALLTATPHYQTGGSYDIATGNQVYPPVNLGDWQAEHSRAFGQQIMEYIHGAQPTETFQPVTDEARGIASARQVAEAYMQKAKLPPPPRRYFPVDEGFGQRTAAAYENLPSQGPIAAGPPVTAADVENATTELKPTPPGVDATTVRAYQAFVKETKAQYEAIQKSGIRFEPTMADPYPNSAAMIADVRDNHNLRVYAGSAEHPLMTDAQTVMFRGVHDYFAHAAEGFQFGPRGELNAAIKHSQMYSAEARRAMLTETHGQNSVVNFSRTATPDGRTIAEVNKATPGAIYAEQKAGLLPQPMLDEFGSRYIGAGSNLASNPDVIRAAQQFVKWSKEALGHGLLRNDPQYAELFTRLTHVPTDAATPANHMHMLMNFQVAQAQRMAMEDAHRLQYFARNRTFLERSVNHPFFGIYPASYMWGKIAPEMARFMATTPFGLRTGVGLKAMQDFQTSVAAQREFDPSFEKMMTALGHSPTAWFLGYMLPSVPWDIGAAAPSWMRNVAEQGLANQQRVAKGEAPKPIDVTAAVTKIGDYINPLRPAGQVEPVLADLGNIISGGTPASKRAAAQATTKATKKSAALRTKLENDLGTATVAVQTGESRLSLAKTKDAKIAAQKRLDALNFNLAQAKAALAAEFPDEPQPAAPPARAAAGPRSYSSTGAAEAEPPISERLAGALGDLLGIFTR